MTEFKNSFNIDLETKFHEMLNDFKSNLKLS